MNASETSSPPATLLSSTDIASRISTKRGTTCSRVTVWRAIKRLGLEPASQTESGFKFYTEAQADEVEASLPRVTNRPDAPV